MALTRSTVRVYFESGKWKVKKGKNSRASSTHRKKSAAKRKGRKIAKKLAKKAGSTELLIETKEGSFRRRVYS